MSFLTPLFLVGASAAAIPIVLHLLKREPEARVKFAAVKLLRHAPVEHTQRRHLRELLLLAARVAALLLLALAFARPFFTSSAALGSAGVTIVALDTSLSLSALTVGRSASAGTSPGIGPTASGTGPTWHSATAVSGVSTLACPTRTRETSGRPMVPSARCTAPRSQ